MSQEDVVESGPRRGAWWWWVVAPVAAGALVVSTLNAGDRAPEPVASATPAVTPSEEPVPNTTYDVPQPVVSEIPVEAPDGPVSLSAPRWTGPHDPLLIAGGGIVLRLRSGDPIASQVEHPGAVVTSFVEVARGTVVVESYGEHGGTAYAAFVARGASASRDLGDVAEVWAAANGTDVWASDAYAGGERITVRKIDPATGRVHRRVTLPAQTAFVGEVSRGFVLQTTVQGGGSGIWDPRTRKYVLRWSQEDAFSVRGENVVLGRFVGCTATCFSVVRSDGTVRARLDAFDTPTVSPDGKRAAAYVMTGEGMRLVVHTLGTGEARTLGNSHMTSRSRVAFAWSRDSRSLYVAVSAAQDEGQIAMWRQGAAGLVLVSGYYAQDVAAE